MTKNTKKQQSLELLNLLQEVKIEIEINTKSKITVRNNAKKTKIFVKIHGIHQTQKYLFTFKDNWTYVYQILKGNWKKPKGNYVSQLVTITTNTGAIDFVKRAANWL